MSNRTRPDYTPDSAAIASTEALARITGRWKLTILFHLFDGLPHRYSDLEKLIPAISQKVLAQQLRQLESDGLLTRTIHPTVPPRVDYQLTPWGKSLCPALDALLTWHEQTPPEVKMSE